MVPFKMRGSLLVLHPDVQAYASGEAAKQNPWQILNHIRAMKTVGDESATDPVNGSLGYEGSQGGARVCPTSQLQLVHLLHQCFAELIKNAFLQHIINVQGYIQ